MAVTTTAIHGTELELIRAGLQRHGMAYAAELSTSTSVLVARRNAGPKYRVAQQRGIPCVTPAWVLLGHCCMGKLCDFELGRSLMGLEVCSTSLTAQERNCVRRVCETHQAKYNPSLTRNSALLVMPDVSPGLKGNEKLEFARSNHIDAIPYCQFMKQYNHAVKARCGPLAVAPRQASLQSTSDVIVYCSPRSLVTETVISLLHQAVMKHAPMLTFLTTHVLLLGPTTEVFYPRPGLEFVSRAWLERCATKQEHVDAEPYRVSDAQRPIITFTGVPHKERASLRASLESSGLPCFVQDNFVLGGTVDESIGRYITTHLVVGQAALAKSSKVAALGWRMHKLGRKECFLVSMEWVCCSLQTGRWVDCSSFTLEVPQLSAFAKLSSCQVSEDAARAANRLEEEHEGASQPCLSEKGMRDDSPHSKSLEKLIQELESRTNALGSALTTPSMGHSWVPLAVVANPSGKTECSLGAGANSSVSVAAACSGGCRLQENQKQQQVESQVIVYGRDDYEYPPKAVAPSRHHHRHYFQKQHVLLSAEGTDGYGHGSVGDVAGAAASERDKEQPEPSGRVCCIMMTKALLYMDENFTRLQALGCTLATSVEECTHYVTGRPSRTEFFLCTVAAGKWVLAPSFLEETLRTGCIAREESHEWRPEIAKAAMLRNSVVDLVRACQLQRRRTVRPFSSWSVILCCATDARTESFSRVLRCGNCSVIRPYSPSQLLDILTTDRGVLHDSTIVLSDDNLWGAMQLETVSVHVPVLKMEYVAHCLCVETPEPDHYVLQGAMHARKRSRDPC
ncbi:topoisomerase (DNA) II binding protein 1 [Trypanosoma grayi]|uniref:topoisomerase (DNA) II binding protein 1 n=1 Tax=Trypanosoma grayi TaxID=71804 RepID=UPI0004F4260F|nr:topoisomerase (DNA) II binding protein 1 [Trypanosoma grayi]KEG13808.1 topoisomerase (DNA) II binding protein 1 [Trypanosoma grayi]